MRLYDFSKYAKRRDELRSLSQVEELIPRLSEPGIVIELKRRVEAWMILHREIDQKIAT